MTDRERTGVNPVSHFSVELFFDSEAEGQIGEQWSCLLEANLSRVMPDSGARPHISLTVADGDVPAGLVSNLAEFAKDLKAFELSFTAFGAFPNQLGVFFLAPRPLSKLFDAYLAWYAVHSKWLAAFGKNTRPRTGHRIALWRPAFPVLIWAKPGSCAEILLSQSRRRYAR
jgi:hypothetical protein